MSFLSEAELHGLVDGHLDAARRTELLQRVAASPFNRERVASWQEQGDLLRAAFRGIDKETVPSELDLRSPVRVHRLPVRATEPAVPDAAPPIAAPVLAPVLARLGRARRHSAYAAAATAGAVAIGLAAAWGIGMPEPAARARIEPERIEPERIEPDRLEPERGTPDALLARRTLAALGGARGGQAAAMAAMPTTVIPDLSASGFAFSGAEPQAGEPATIVFRYRNDAAEQVAVGVARVAEEGGPARAAGGVYAWRLGNRAYAVAGTLPRGRLRAIAVLLKGDAVDD